jgi:hypothetical protein
MVPRWPVGKTFVMLAGENKVPEKEKKIKIRIF